MQLRQYTLARALKSFIFETGQIWWENEKPIAAASCAPTKKAPSTGM